MGNSSPNLFDLSGGGAKKGPPKKKVVPSRPKESPHLDKDTAELLTRMKEQHEELQGKIDEVLSKKGLSPGQLKSFFANPSNFSEKEWSEIKQQKGKLAAKILGVSETAAERKIEDTEISKAAKDRRGKTLGARRKWLNMH